MSLVYQEIKCLLRRFDAKMVHVRGGLTAVFVQFWKEVVEDAEVRELIWDKSNAAQGKLHGEQ